LVVYGSFTRAENRVNSDLDLFIVLKSAPRSRLDRSLDFVRSVELPSEAATERSAGEDVHTEVSPLILTESEAAHFLPLYLDMADHCVLIRDSGFLKDVLEETRRKMKRWGSRKKTVGGHWYWEIKPGAKWDEVIDYDQ
jgi:hypothetical protein